MALYTALCAPPPEALKSITAGRLKGKTDINPMWRIKALTEQFGPCGIGWKYEITKQWTEVGSDNQISVFCNINLYYKYLDEWSQAVPGTGGSMFVTKESKDLHTSDECYKMALTDAISVAAKALGVAGNIYWDKNPTKYTTAKSDSPPKTCVICGKPVEPDVYKYSLQKYKNVYCGVDCLKQAGITP